MVSFCAVFGCSNSAKKEKTVGYFRLPKIITYRGKDIESLTTERQKKWLANINRKDLKKSTYQHIRICGKHFVTGKPALMKDVTDIDWAPSVNLGYAKHSNNFNSSATSRQNRAVKRSAAKEMPRLIQYSPSHTIASSNSSEINVMQSMDDFTEESQFKEAGIQTDITGEAIEALLKKSDELEKETDKMQKRSNEVQQKLDEKQEKILQLSFTEESFKRNEEKCKYYSGMASFQLLITIFHFLHRHVPYSDRNKLTQFEEFVLVLMRLRLNLGFSDLGYRFGVAQSTACRIFDRWMPTMHARLSHLIFWPDRETLYKTMPLPFQRTFGKNVAVILDCFEVFIDRPSALYSRAVTWSNYKHHNTAKFLIGITPQGSISFISKAWGGRASDKHIVENCSILNNLLPGDVVLADRGFSIADSVGFYCAKLAIPAFTRGKKQLSAVDVEETRKIANLRIHVERVIGLVRRKFKILHSTLPVDSLRPRNGPYSDLDRIVSVCCALSNLSPSVVPLV